MRRLVRPFVGILLGALTTASAASADEEVDVCIDAAEQSQALRDGGRLIEARRGFSRCAAETCPAVIRKDCAGWHEDVDALMPSIITRAQNEAGEDLVDAVTAVDGVAVPHDGRPYELDPGPHVIVWRWRGQRHETRVIVRAGEKLRVIERRFERPEAAREALPAPAPSPPSEPSAALEAAGFHVPVAGWILGGVALTGGVLFAVFASEAVRRFDELSESCAPRCEPSDVAPIERDLIIGNVAGGVGLAALAAGVVVTVLANLDHDVTARAPIDVVVTPTHAALGLTLPF